MKIEPLIDQLRTTTEQANEALKHVDSLVMENKDDIRASIKELHTALISVNALTDKLNETLDSNSDNIDQLLLNFRDVSENLRQLTDNLKSRPSSLIFSHTAKDRNPGDKQ